MQTANKNSAVSAPLELALQELEAQQLDMQELEALDAPDFSWSAALSAVGGLSAGGVISYVSIVTLAT
ncbi:daptide-type RiPP [Streptomyces griseus]|uniref:daptide-type RiPP n=1 Tax=Streptomyces griseus TaxID=1911 RepID=UPI00056777DF|nr:daptide-type RiPP [Streptomyces griseus]